MSKRLVMYELESPQPNGNSLLVIRRSKKNKKGKHVLDEQFDEYGLYWPNKYYKDRDAVALAIGQSILTELGK